MPYSQKKLILDEPVRKSQPGKYKLDELEPARFAKHLVMFEPSEAILIDLVAKARLSIPNIAPTSEALKVYKHNPNCVMALARRSKFDPKAPVAEGFVAILPLNELGLQVLALGSFDAVNPDLRLIAKPHERPAGVYLWAVFAPGSLASGIALFMEKIAAPQYANANIYSRPVNDRGRNYLEVLGFVQGGEIGEVRIPDSIWVFTRRPQVPLYDSYVPHSGKKDVGITVARTFDDLMRVAAIRNAVYIGEQECPYEEEYDGNDLSATHLLAYMGDEPIGCLRVRFFADFVKFERMAIRKEFRKSRAAILLSLAGLRLAGKKGYRHAYAHSQSRLVGFWKRFGFSPLSGAKPFVFSDFDYVELVADIEPDADPVKLGGDPYTLIRPEGRWHKPGILEQSASRPATNPSVAKKR